MQGGRWTEISPSQFDHEKDGLDIVETLLPDAPPFRAWSNFEFRDNKGRWHEVDLLVLARDTLYLIELKYYSGVLRGNDHVWRRGGHRSEDSPLLLARRKAQYFASLLKDRLIDRVGPVPRGTIPYVQELVFLHHPNLVCELPPSSAINLYGLDGNESRSNLPGISERLLGPTTRAPVSEEKSLLLADLMRAIGLAPRRQRELGSWVIDEEPLDDGDGWQDWPAFHHVDTERSARIRFYLPKPGSSPAEEHARVRAVEGEYRLLARLKHDGLQVPVDVVKDRELGIGLVFLQPKDVERLDLWLADNATTLTLEDQLELLGQLAEVVLYAHRHRVVHRTLNPRAVTLRMRGKNRLLQVTDWDSAGVLPANSEMGTSSLSGGLLSLDADTLSEQARLFAAPEGKSATDPVRMDVFGIGALAFYLLSAGAAPATDRGELMDRLRRDRGLDLAAEMPEVPSALRQLVLDATNPSPADRIATVTDFLDRLEDTRHRLIGSPGETDPLEAGPGAVLSDGRFEYRRRLGAGSTAVGILVVDNKAGRAQRVLKVARDDEAAARLRAEAQVLGKLNDPRIVQLNTEEIVGGRTALVLQWAGRTTLAEELAGKDGGLSIDLLERWGSDLLTALVALERAGVTHRDIKPANLGVFSSSQRADTHLMMFDFSMAGVDPRNIEAGTPPYLDPFLGLTGSRRTYDTAAERYGAAVVLFEMATGNAPQYGPDPQANPATVDDDVTLAPEMFEAAVAESLSRFFASALSRDSTARPDTAEDMLRAWRAVFTELDAAPAPSGTADAAATATVITALSHAGLSPRAVSALAAISVTTVGELLALDSTRLNRLVAKEAKNTRVEIRDRYREWAKSLGRQAPVASGQTMLSLDDAVQLLLAALGSRRTTRRTAGELLLGEKAGLDAFASGHELARVLKKANQRGHQLIKELQAEWAENPATRELLDGVIDLAQQVLRDSGDVVAIPTLTAEIRARMPQPASTAADAMTPVLAERAAAGLLRAAFDRLTEHETADGAKRLVRRRHDGRLALVADDEVLLAAAEAVGKRADELVFGSTSVVVPFATAARELREAFSRAYRSAAGPDVRVPLPPDPKLVRLAAATSRLAHVSGRSELHTRALDPSEVLRWALAGLSQSESLTPNEVRARAAARFPELDRLPPRTALDAMIERAGLGLTWADGAYRYQDAAPPSESSLHTRGTTRTGMAPEQGPGANVDRVPSARHVLLRQSLRENGFVAIGVPIPADRAGEHVRVARKLADSFNGVIVDVTGEIIAAMRELAEARGVPWDLVRGADAAAEGSRDAHGLRAVLDQVMPPLVARLESTVVSGEPTGSGPVILTELSPLARYGHMDLLARLSDLSARRRRPVWAILPQIRGQRGALVDGKPIQLGSPGGQFVTWTPIVGESGEKVQ